MDASTIRLILIVVGALAILLLYLWERHREKQEEYDEDAYLEDDEDGTYDWDASERDPDLDEDAYEDERDAVQSTKHASPARPAALSDSDVDAYFAEAADGGADEDPEERTLADAGLRSAPSETPEPLLIQVSVSARRYPFKGTDVMEVAERCGLYPGDMEIFHCLDEFDDRTRVYFSMANMIKPGTFPFDAMETFSTPGLMLFAQLEGDPEDMTILDEMVATARKLALALNGDVLDDARRPLTVKKEEQMRQAVLDNEMRWAKAVMR